MKLDVVGAAYQARSKTIDAQECINFYPEVQQQNSKNVVALIGTPGMRLLCTPTTGFCRGMYTTSSGRTFTVVNSGLYEFYANGTVILRGTITGQANRVYMADNGLELILVGGAYGYLMNLSTNTFGVIGSGFPSLGADLGGANGQGADRVAFMAGRFVVNATGTGRFYFSAAYNGASWGALDWYTAEGAPDDLIALVNSKNELWLIGSQTVEAWYMTGDSDEPFARINGALNNIGCAAKDTLATNGNQLFWLGANAQGQGVVWSASGYIPERISTHGIEYIIGQLSRTDDAVGYCYQQEGHAFYVLNFPAGGRTLVYDLTTGMWHERSFWQSEPGEHDAHLAVSHTAANGVNYVGSREDGGVYVYDLDSYTDNGEIIRRERTTAHQAVENKRVTFNHVELEMERGTADKPSLITVSTGSTVLEPAGDPYMVLNVSDDGGFTWSSNKYASMGQMALRSTRVRWNRLGCSRDRLFRFWSVAPVKTNIIDAYASLEVEP